MNRLALVLLFCIAASSPVSSTSVCMNKNPYISLLKQYHVKIYQTPQSNSLHCGQEWATHGTCCEPTSLVNYSKDMIQNIANMIDWIGVKTTQILAEADKICTPIAIMQTMKAGGCEAINIDGIKSIYLAIKKIGSLFSTQNSQCFLRLKEMRTNALCSVCSGKSQDYFLGVRVKFWNSDCLKVIDDCKPLWDALVRGLKTIQDLKGKIGNPMIENLLNQFFNTNNVKSFVDYYTGAQIVYHLERCPSKSNCPVDSQVAICNAMVSLINPSIYQGFKMILYNAPKQNTFSIADKSRPAARRTQKNNPTPAPKPTPAPVVFPPMIPAPAANPVSGQFGSGAPKFGNWGRRLLNSSGSTNTTPNGFVTPAGGHFEPMPTTSRSLTDVSTVCSFAAQGCQQSSIAMNLNLQFP